jgi:alkanesulfonate monooxygenase
MGAHYSLIESPALPKPARRIPVIVGGMGPKRTPALAARFADEFNVPFQQLHAAIAQYERVAQACTDAGRDPAEIVRSCAHALAVGTTDVDVARRFDATGLPEGAKNGNPLVGSPAQVVDALGQWREKAGLSRVYLQVHDLSDLDHLELVAAEVAPQLA